MGTVLVGKHDTPYKLATGNLDQFADTLGDYNGLMGAAGSANLLKSGEYFDLRAANVAAYITPTFSGFHAAAGYVFGAESATSGTANKGNAYSLAAIYDAGPLFVSAAYEKHNVGDAGTGSLGIANVERKAWKLGAQYSVMDFTFGAAYEKTDDNMGAGGVNAFGHRTYFLSGKYQMGAVALKAQYANAGDQAVANSGAKQYTVGADYAFSKRTTVYALYTKISNDSAATYNFGVAPASNAVAGDSLSGLSLGMKHSF
jgi:predicted porin